MRSERRHELQQNELADWLNEGIEAVKPYTNMILGLTLLVLILVVAGTWWTKQSSAEAAEAWDAYHNALAMSNPTELAMVAADYPNSRAASWAETVAGDLYLKSGCDQLFTSRADANIELDKAAESYQRVLDGSHEAALLDRATFGLARTREAMGEVEKAKELYEKITQTWPNGPFATVAARRVKQLKEPSTLAFYDKFEKFDPKPAFADEPGIPGAGPLFDDESLLVPNSSTDLDSLPNLDLDSMKNDGTK